MVFPEKTSDVRYTVLSIEVFGRRDKDLEAVWPDLAKFRQFGTSLQVFGKNVDGLFLICKILSLLWQICDIIVLIFIVANGQIMKNNLTIWSHCLEWKGKTKINETSRVS